ncbi:MAG TPA: c-type cytochrome biogenesis protein CcsB [Candidatus Dormibacteraeota bacterium]|nr:c-type cytochrome biogenesis protein CcsB [Candidatus Dormibacteraeota bacterium]
MMQTLVTIFYALAVVLYAAGALTLFAYFLWRKSWQVAIGVPLAIAGLVAQVGAIVSEAFATGWSPTSNLYDSLSLFVAFTVLLFLIFARQYRLWALGGFVLLISDFFLAYAGTWNEGYRPLVPSLQSYWLAIHVPTVVAAYAAFMLAFCTSVLYLVKYYLERGHSGGAGLTSMGLQPAAAGAAAGGSMAMATLVAERTGNTVQDETPGLALAAAQGDKVAQWLMGIPSLAKLDVITYRIIAVGLPLLSLGIIMGAMWAKEAWGAYWQWDPKETSALVCWIIYLAYMHLHTRSQWRGMRTSWISVIGFAAVIFCYLGVNIWISGLHSYKV